ncbi:hypothetical protein ACO0QE_003371 [Hanseniaspora vineae]
MLLTQGSIPEVQDISINEALRARHLKLGSPAWQNYPLGPPDLVCLYKYIPVDPNQHIGVNSNTSTSGNNNRSGNTNNNEAGDAYEAGETHEDFLAQIKKKLELGTHFYNSGIDTSDPTSIAVFCKSIKEAIEENGQQLWYGKQKHFRVGHIAYSTYNCFSQCDMNVVVKFPGNIETYLTTSGDGDVALREDHPGANEELWLETFVSGVVRSFTQMMDNKSEGELNSVVETKIYNPLLMNDINDIAELFITKGFPLCYDKGFTLGGPVDCIGITNLNNYLVEVYCKIVQLSGYHEMAVSTLDEMISKMGKKFRELHYLKARILFENNRKMESLDIINEELQSKGKTGKPSVPNGVYKNELILLQINVLYSIVQDKEIQQLESDAKDIMSTHQMINKLSKHLCKISPSEFRPWYWLVKSYTSLKDFENALLALNSCPMNMTKDKYVFKRMDNSGGYGTRNGTGSAASSSSFDNTNAGGSNNANGNNNNNNSNPGSTQPGSPESMHLPLPVDVVMEDITGLNSQDVISEHMQASAFLMNLPGSSLKTTYAIAYSLLVDIVNLIGWEKLLVLRSDIFVMEEEFHEINSRRASASELEDEGLQNGGSGHAVGKEGANKSFLKDDKRLCERWLDNLFMVLYQDMKQYTIWQAEQVQFESNGTEYTGSTFEWELLGLLANRLKHFNEGSLAFQSGLKQRFSGVCCKKLIEYYVNEKNKILQNYKLSSGVILKNVQQLNNLLLDLCVQNMVWNHRWYIEFSLNLQYAFKSLIEQDGLEKLENEIKSKYSEEVYALCYDNALKFFSNQRVIPSDSHKH